MSEIKLVGEKMSDNIWFTSKARMEAEKRFKMYDVVSHLILVWYSILLLFLTTFSTSFEPNVLAIDIGDLTTFLSACVLVFSVIIWGFKFGEKAALHRDCYLELEALLSRNHPNQQKKYAEIMKRFPNHSPFDFNSVLFNRIKIKGENLTNNGVKVKFGFWQTVFYCLLWLRQKLVLLIIFCLPLILAYYLYV